MDQFRICRITDSFPPPWSGLSPAPYGLSKAQHELGNEMVVITKWRNGCEDIDHKLPFCVIRTHAKRDFFDFASYIHFVKIHRKNPFDILHIHGSSIFWIQFINNFIKVIDIPVVVSVHNIRDYQNQIYRTTDMFTLTEKALNRNISKERNAILRGFRKWFYTAGVKQRLSYRSADMLLPVSQALAEQLIATIGADKNKIKILPNGVDSASFAKNEPVNLSKLGISQSDRVLLFVGRLLCTKDITSLIMSMKYLNISGIKLLIIGDGPWSDIYHKIVEKQVLQKDVIFIPNVPHDKMPSYYKRCDIFVFTSFSEGLPKVVLEAMAAGKPIIGADVEGVRDLVDVKNGRLFKPNSPKSIAENISILLSNSNLTESMGQQSITLVQQRYTWEKIAARCQSYYNLLLN